MFFFLTEVGDNKIIEPDNEKNQQNNVKEKKTKKEITLNKALEMADKIKMYCLRKGILDSHSKVPSISDIAD